MRILVVLSFVLIYRCGFSQETKFILKPGVGFTEEYYVLKNNKNVKHGTYVKYRLPFSQIVIIESGSYSNGEKNGLWQEFYNEFSRKTWNAIKEQGQYVNGKRNGTWTYYHLDTTANEVKSERTSQLKSINVTVDQRGSLLRMAGNFLNDQRVGEWTSWNRNGEVIQKYNFSNRKLLAENSIKDTSMFNTTRKPLFVGGTYGLFSHLISNFGVTKIIEKLNKDTTITIATFKIDKEGKVNEIQVFDNSGVKKLADELIRTISTTEQSWIPGLKNGEPIDYMLKLRHVITKGETSSNSKSWKSSFALED